MINVPVRVLLSVSCRSPRWLLGGLEIIPLICHIRRVQETRCHCLWFLDTLCVASNLHLFIKYENLLDALFTFSHFLLRFLVMLWRLLSCSSFCWALTAFLSLWVDSLSLNLILLRDHLIASLVVETVLETIDFILQAILVGGCLICYIHLLFQKSIIIW